MNKQKVIFMTGATGFVGSHLACELLNQGYRVILLVRGDNPTKRVDDLLCRLYGDPEEYNKVRERVEIVSGDITKENLRVSPKDFAKLNQKACKVFHCAASISFNEAEKEKIEKQNVDGTKNILEFMRRLNLHELHYISTAYVSGRRTGVIYEDELEKEQSFNNTYEESKFNAEKLVRRYKEEYGIIATVYRPTIIVGDSRTGKTSSYWGFYSCVKSLHLLMRMFKKDPERGRKGSWPAGMYRKEDLLNIPLRIRGMASRPLNLLPIDYLVETIIKILENESNYDKTYHIVNPEPPTFGQIQIWVSRYLGISGIRIVDPLNFRADQMNQWESFFDKTINTFAPYLQKEGPVFSDANTQKALSGACIKFPLITEELISKLISYCVDGDWGRNVKCAVIS